MIICRYSFCSKLLFGETYPYCYCVVFKTGVVKRAVLPTMINGDNVEKALACCIIWELAWNDDNRRKMNVSLLYYFLFQIVMTKINSVK